MRPNDKNGNVFNLPLRWQQIRGCRLHDSWTDYWLSTTVWPANTSSLLSVMKAFPAIMCNWTILTTQNPEGRQVTVGHTRSEYSTCIGPSIPFVSSVVYNMWSSCRVSPTDAAVPTTTMARAHSLPLTNPQPLLPAMVASSLLHALHAGCTLHPLRCSEHVCTQRPNRTDCILPPAPNSPRALEMVKL